MKRKLLILLIALLAVTLSFTACFGGKEEEKNNSIQSIKVVEGSVPTEVNIGTTPDFSGIKVTVTYADQSTKEVGFADVTLSDPDTTTVGNKSVTVTYEGVTTRFTISVIDPEATAVVTSIKILINDKDKSCYIGELFDMSVLQVEATYNTGRTGALAIDKYDLTTVDTSTAGTKTITATYKENTTITASVNIEVIGVSALSVVKGTVENRITAGETLDVSGIQVIPQYTNGYNGEELSYSDLTIENIDTTEVGEKQLRITYKGFTAEYTVTVVESSALVVEKGSYPEFIDIGSTLDLSGIKAHYTDPLTEAAEKNIPFANLTVDMSAVDMSVPGDKQIAISYKGVTAAIIVHVRGVESMTVMTDDGKPSELFMGNALDISKLSLNVKYTYGKGDTVRVTENMLGSFDVNKHGAQDLPITYLDKTINHSIYVYTVVGLYVDEDTIGRETIDIGKMKIYGVCDNSDKSLIELKDGTVETNRADINIESDGDKLLTVKYSGMYGTLEDTVTINMNIQLVGIKIDSYQTTVRYGKVYNKDSVVVIASYNNGKSRRLNSGYDVSDVKTTEAGDVDLTVTYTEKGVKQTATATVKVLKVTGLSVSGIADLVDVGNKLDLTYAQIAVTFEDNTTSVIGIGAAEEISEPDTETASNERYLTVSYGGITVNVPYVVRDVANIEIFGGIGSTVNKGYAIDYLNLLLKVTYTNNETTVKAASDLPGVTYEGTDIATEAGKINFVVRYKELYAIREITVVDQVVEVDRISALNKTIPAVVFKDPTPGKTLSYDSFKLLVYYKNGEVALVPVSDDRVSVNPEAFYLNEAGVKAIRFYFNDGTTTFETIVNIWVKEVTKVEIVEGTVLKAVIKDKVYDTKDLQVKVTYDDGSYSYVSRTNNDLKVTEPDVSKVGTTTLKVSFMGVEATMEITVKEPNTVSGIFGVLKPDELSARESYAKNFKDQTSAYRVGDDNPYYFYLNVISLDANDNLVDIDGMEVATSVRIFLVEGNTETELTGDALTAMVNFVSSENSYDFTEDAIGKTFKLVACPVGYDTMTKEHTVTVVDGYNIYKAYELNVMTNCGNNIVKAIDGATPIYQKDVATEFLRKKGITRPEKLAGIVLHCNLNVTENDIPAEYICSYTRNGIAERGLYDQLGIFHRELTTDQKTFSIYGNYYSVYSYGISPVAHKGFGGNPDEFSSSDLFKIRTSTGVYSSLNLNIGENQMVFDDYKVNIQDIATRDNDPNSNDQSASERHMRGIICYKLGACVANVTNINIEAYQTSMLVEDANTTINLNKSNFYNAWQGHLFIWNDNYVQRYFQGDSDKTTPTAAYARDVVVNITESSLTKCGGPVIISQATKTDYAYNNASGVQVYADAASDLHTYVTGQEAWFVAVGQTQLAAQIKAMNRMVMLCQNNDMSPKYGSNGYIATNKIQGVETVNMVMVNMGEGVAFDGTETYNGYFKHGDNVAMAMSNGKNTREIYTNSSLSTYIATTTAMNGSPAPIYQSSAGGTALTDGKTGCYGLETGALGAPQQNFYAGRYITLYYAGVGIAMEYYHQ